MKGGSTICMFAVYQFFYQGLTPFSKIKAHWASHNLGSQEGHWRGNWSDPGATLYKGRQTYPFSQPLPVLQTGNPSSPISLTFECRIWGFHERMWIPNRFQPFYGVGAPRNSSILVNYWPLLSVFAVPQQSTYLCVLRKWLWAVSELGCVSAICTTFPLQYLKSPDSPELPRM